MFENRRLNIFCIAMIACCALAGCGKGADTHAEAAKDVVVELQSVSDAIAGVTDKASADAAGTRITTAAGNIDKIAARIKKMPQASKDENDAIHVEVTPQMTTIKSTMQSNITRLRSKPEALAALQGPMAQLQMSLAGVGAAVVGGSPNSAETSPPPPAGPAAPSPTGT